MVKMRASLQIIRVLLAEKSYMTIDRLAEKLGLSNRSIRYRWEEIEQILSRYHLQLIRKPGRGVLIQGKEENKLLLKGELYEQMIYDAREFSDSRRVQIISELLLKYPKQGLKLHHLENFLYVDRSKVYKLLEKASEWLAKRGLTVQRSRYGWTLQYGEKRIRKALFDLTLQKIKAYGSEEELLDYYMEKDSVAIQKAPLFKGKTFAAELVALWERLIAKHFLTTERQRLNLKFRIAFYRIEHQALVTLGEETIYEFRQLGYASQLDTFVKTIEERKHWKIPEAEKYYLFGLLLSASYEQSELLIQRNQVTNRKMADYLLESLQTYVPVAQPVRCRERLLHLVNSYTVKARYELDFFHPYEDIFPELYPDIYAQALEVVREAPYPALQQLPYSEVTKLANVMLTEQELAKKKVPTLFVYEGSFADVEYLYTVLVQRFSELEISPAQPLSDFQKGQAGAAPLLLTNNKALVGAVASAHVVEVPPYLEKGDIDSLRDLVDTIYEQYNRNYIGRGREDETY